MVHTPHRPQARPGLSHEPSYGAAVGAAVLCVVSPIMGMLAWRLALMIASSTFSIWYRRATFTAGSTLLQSTMPWPMSATHSGRASR